jgi:hypothetical protein
MVTIVKRRRWRANMMRGLLAMPKAKASNLAWRGVACLGRRARPAMAPFLETERERERETRQEDRTR